MGLPVAACHCVCSVPWKAPAFAALSRRNPHRHPVWKESTGPLVDPPGLVLQLHGSPLVTEAPDAKMSEPATVEDGWATPAQDLGPKEECDAVRAAKALQPVF